MRFRIYMLLKRLKVVSNYVDFIYAGNPDILILQK
jgi:hypothetical protein